MKKFSSIVAVVGLVLSLPGCGGSQAGGLDGVLEQANAATPKPNVEDVPSTKPYFLLDSHSSGQSQLKGIAIRSGGNSSSGNTFVLVSTDGTMNHKTGATTISDKQFTLSDANGFDDHLVLTDGTSRLILSESLDTHDYSLSYQQSYFWQGKAYDLVGIIGNATRISDLPNSGTATFRGGASGVMVSTTSSYDLLNGTSVVNANFGTSTASIVLSGFQARDLQTGGIIASPLDKISVTGAIIDGNQITGGNVRLSQQGSNTNFVGSNSNSSVGATLFGIDGPSGMPSEIGGFAMVQGDEGFIIGNFISE